MIVGSAGECALARTSKKSRSRSAKRGGGRQGGRGTASETRPERRARRSFALAWGLLVAGFVLAGLVIYAPALDGGFISDDEHYVAKNVYVHELTPSNILAILDPTSVLARVVENYAPVHVFLHALEWKLFGPNVRGYHVVNVVLHALATGLLVLLYRRSGASTLGAVLAGAIFLVHPANVEVVAWISQLKTSSSMILMLLALRSHPRRPALGVVLFALALMAKPTAAVGLFVLIAFGWLRTGGQASESARTEGGPQLDSWRWGWIAGWAGVLVLFAVAEFAAFSQTAGQATPLYQELGVRYRTVLAIALRYLVMASTSFGLSTFHEPAPAESWLDPWFVGSLAVLALLGWRTWVVFRRRSVEGAFWLWAVVSFAPVCGVIPLPYPMADRYLYYMLPGLIGGLLLAGPELVHRIAGALGERLEPRLWLVIRVASVLLIAVFAVRSFDRAYVWRGPYFMMADAEKNYPQGTAAKTRQATRAALVGDAETAVAALRAACARGYNRLDHLLVGPYVNIQDDDEFQALKRELANQWIERVEKNPSPSQLELRLVAQAYIVLDDLPAAARTLRRGLEVEGPIDDTLESNLNDVERAMRFRH